MCNRFGAEHLGELVDRLAVHGERTADFAETRPTDPASVIVRNPKRQRNEFMEMRWGLFPVWADDPKIRIKLINARAETLDKTNAYREPFKSRRCLIPISHFYEFSKDSRYLVTMKDNSVMAIGGLWESRMWEGSPMVTFTMVTTAPNELVATVHDRMPAVLRDEDYDRWLDPGYYDPTELKAMLTPLPSEAMCMEFAGRKVSARRAQEELL